MQRTRGAESPDACRAVNRASGMLTPAALVVTLIAAAGALAQSLQVTQAEDQVRIAAPEFHFIKGKPLERLRNGNSVPFDFQLSVLGEGKTSVIHRAFERFVISYDLWEQTYSVSRLRSSRTQVSHLTAPQAEAWCLEGIAVETARLPKDQPLWFRLEVRAQEPKANDPAFDETGMSLIGLIDVFSRAARDRSSRDQWRIESGPLRLRAK